MINSPLNYTGNKFKLLKQIMPFLNSQSDYFVDVFSGSGLVGLNSDCKNVILNDNNKITIQLLEYFKNNNSEDIIKKMDEIIEKYGFTDTHRNGNKNYPQEKHEGLSRYNKEPFNKLKEDYNNNPSVEKLFALIIYGFNHYIRFNSKGKYNVPVGKVDYSTSLRNKTEEYIESFKKKNIEIYNYDFRNKELYKNKEAIYYFDPPYLITEAPYNNMWDEKDEKDLLELLDFLDKNNIKFALSNVVESNGKENKLLKEWSKKYNIHYMDRKYLNSNYRKKNITIAKEVLITNYEKEEVKVMGTAGNTKGNKIFNFETSFRCEGEKTIEYLRVLKDYDNIVLKPEIKEEIYIQTVKKGITRLANTPEEIRLKYLYDEELTYDEVQELLRLNPQRLKLSDRAARQIRTIKNQGLISLQPESNNKRLYKLIITPVGNQILENDKVDLLYTKLMIGLHANNPERVQMTNKSRPFLNTIFVINEINNYMKKNNKDQKGITYFEFGLFVLSMIDCDYKQTAKDIISYRGIYGNKIDEQFAIKYLKDRKIVITREIMKNVKKEYPDDVLRKFKNTGLFMVHGYFENTYINFEPYNLIKVQAILDYYKNYKFEEFKTITEYDKYISEIIIPWEINEQTRKQEIKYKEEILGVKVNKNYTLEQQEEYLEEVKNEIIFKKQIDNLQEVKEVIKELEYLVSGKKSEKYDDIKEPLRLEWLTAIFLAKIYGKDNVKANLQYNNEGIPQRTAGGNEGDIYITLNDKFWLVEVTMIKNKTQQINAETINLFRHLETKEEYSEKYLSFIAPIVHTDTKRIINVCTIESMISFDGIDIYSKSYKIEEFIKETLNKNNLKDMKENTLNFVKSVKEKINNI